MSVLNWPVYGKLLDGHKSHPTPSQCVLFCNVTLLFILSGGGGHFSTPWNWGGLFALTSRMWWNWGGVSSYGLIWPHSTAFASQSSERDCHIRQWVWSTGDREATWTRSGATASTNCQTCEGGKLRLLAQPVSQPAPCSGVSLRRQDQQNCPGNSQTCDR